MKTFAIMFILLSIINIPVLAMYQSNTVNNNFQNINQFFKYFTIGNLGQTDSKCETSKIDLE